MHVTFCFCCCAFVRLVGVCLMLRGTHHKGWLARELTFVVRHQRKLPNACSTSTREVPLAEELTVRVTGGNFDFCMEREFVWRVFGACLQDACLAEVRHQHGTRPPQKTQVSLGTTTQKLKHMTASTHSFRPAKKRCVPILPCVPIRVACHQQCLRARGHVLCVRVRAVRACVRACACACAWGCVRDATPLAIGVTSRVTSRASPVAQ